MLELIDIRKEYRMGEETVHALKGVNLKFPENGFVAILGQSGCGKTTLLNIIGGLDQYTSGDLIINGVSTKKYKNSDWDTYRNNSIGFVFQSYQLIPHQTVLNNVELTMTLSGISSKERKNRAVEALKKVGLGDQLRKKPNQMSGGQMQRTAIARALVNDPDIILADEPTGALDTETSIQIMNILQEVSKDHLVIMVTHNPELAEEYATRIVQVKDGLVISDRETKREDDAPSKFSIEVGMEDGKSASVTGDRTEEPATEKKKETKKKKSMSFFTALSLSLNNLMTKKGRTFLTAFAGAIGIIGIAMILALSTGVQKYIDSVESDTLSQYPLRINRETVDFSEMMQSMMGNQNEETEERDDDRIWSNNMMSDMITNIANERIENDMRAFKKYVEESEELKQYLRAVEYGYSTVLNVYNTDAETDSGILQVNPATVMSQMGMTEKNQSGMSVMNSASNVWTQLPENRAMVEQLYEVLDGRFPENYDEIVVAVTENGEIGDYTLYALGLYDQEELKTMMQDAMMGKELEKKEKNAFEYADLENLRFSVLPNYAFYEEQKDGTYEDKSEDEKYIRETLPKEGIELKITGIVRVKKRGTSELGLYGGVLYQPSLMKELLKRNETSEIAEKQRENPDTDVFTGIDFPKKDEEKEPLTMEGLQAYIMTLDQKEQMTMQGMISAMQAQGYTDAEIVAQFEAALNKTTDATFDGNMDLIGVQDEENPSVILLYPNDFEAKDSITDILDDYSKSLEDGRELKYTDYVGMLMSSITKIINVITYILIGFVGISLVVSSIMIGIITYISVMERTREIGILRSIGASRQDIARVFNAETLIIGFVSGLIGIGIPYVVSIFVNRVIFNHFGINNIMYLHPLAAVALVIISMLLTLIGGIIPSLIAAFKDPVEALRTE